MSFIGRLSLTLLLSCLIAQAKAATPLKDLTFKDGLYYLNDGLYTGDVTLTTNNYIYNKDGSKAVKENRKRGRLNFTGSIKKGRRDGKWITRYPFEGSKITIVENYRNAKLSSIDVYRNALSDIFHGPYIQGRLTNHDNRWQWKFHSRTFSRSLTYTGETISVMPKGKMTSFFTEDGKDFTQLSYIDKDKANIKLQIFHIILPKSDYDGTNSDLRDGPSELIRDGRWEVIFKNQLNGNVIDSYAKYYIYGRDLSTYSAELEYNEDGTSEFTGWWRPEDNPTGYEMTVRESTLYDKEGNISYHQIIDPKNSIKRNEKYYPNGNIQYTNLMISNKYVVLLEYYPTGELFKQSIFPSQKNLNHYRQKIAASLFYSQEGDLVNPKNQSALSIFNNPKRFNQKSVRELFHDSK